MSTKLTSSVIEAWAGLVRTERAVSDRIEERLKNAGLPPLDWYHVLHEVDRSPKGMMRQSGVQSRTQLAQYNLCRLVDRLEGEGLVERHQCQVDGRNNVVVITAKGRALHRAMWPVYAAAIEEQFGARLSPAEAEQLAHLLARVAPV
ncbi:MAG: MarR family winged helix-turn-helix transcriptional regulator [Hyphomonadaceae bacterium]|jgi:DNA-binding MarR family transcriptional regulator|nr:MarR family winged helix-turn-helix transcriptional regulator [Hyphomonadaceae bacterium]